MNTAGGEEEGFISQEMVSSLLQEAMDSEAKSQLDRPNIREQYVKLFLNKSMW